MSVKWWQIFITFTVSLCCIFCVFSASGFVLYSQMSICVYVCWCEFLYVCNKSKHNLKELIQPKLLKALALYWAMNDIWYLKWTSKSPPPSPYKSLRGGRTTVHGFLPANQQRSGVRQIVATVCLINQ